MANQQGNMKNQQLSKAINQPRDYQSREYGNYAGGRNRHARPTARDYEYNYNSYDNLNYREEPESS
jgi:hypothetical protein